MDFNKDALGYLISFTRKTGGKPFSAEQVTLAAVKDGIAPPDLRQWGKVFSQAARDGYIRRAGVAFRRQMGNGTLTLGWVAA
jgi:hypothetical protein